MTGVFQYPDSDWGRTSDARTTVFLTGGLGNQLFQLAAGMVHSGEGPVTCLTNLGVPRMTPSGQPEVADLILPDRIRFAKCRCSSQRRRVIARAIGAQLTLSSYPETTWNSETVLRLRQSLLSALVTFCPDIPTSVFISSNVGFDRRSIHWPSNKSRLLVGYFQSRLFATAEIVSLFRRGLDELPKSTELRQFESQAQMTNPLAVHIRLGDYRQNPTMGLLDATYYRQGVRDILMRRPTREIWLFSDEPTEAQKILGEVGDGVRIRLIDKEASISSSLTLLHLMTLARDYVISNSSLSFWAAALTTSQDAQVIAPQPWFALQTDPHELIPPTWRRIRGHSRQGPHSGFEH